MAKDKLDTRAPQWFKQFGAKDLEDFRFILDASRLNSQGGLMPVVNKDAAVCTGGTSTAITPTGKASRGTAAFLDFMQVSVVQGAGRTATIVVTKLDDTTVTFLVDINALTRHNFQMECKWFTITPSANWLATGQVYAVGAW